MRAVLVNGAAALPLGGDRGFALLGGISLAYLFVGIIVFGVSEATAKRRGSLARY